MVDPAIIFLFVGTIIFVGFFGTLFFKNIITSIGVFRFEKSKKQATTIIEAPSDDQRKNKAF